MSYLQWYIDINLAFIIRMLLIFSAMMLYYHSKKGEVGIIFKVCGGIFYVADILYNWFSTIHFLDKPAKWDETISLRCTRYVKAGWGNNPMTWFRYAFAKVIQLVTEFSDPGHI